MKKILLFSFLFLLISVSVSFAGNEPYVISFQGKLDPVPLPGEPTDIEFELFKDESGNTSTGWSEEHKNVTVDGNGIFNVFLGKSGILDIEEVILGSDVLWLKITVNTVPLEPMQAFTAAPYAFRALHASKASEAKFLRGGDIIFSQASQYPINPSAGMMAYNATRDKVAVYDNTGSKWVEIDPVYTENQIWMRKVEEPSTSGSGASLWSANSFASDCIITGIGLRKISLLNALEGIKIELYVDGQLALEYWPTITGKDGNYWFASAQYTLPIPLKVPKNKGVSYKITFEGGYTGVGAVLRGLYVHYIFLPL